MSDLPPDRRPAVAAPLTGVVGGRFDVQRLLGAGGQARTWLARDLETGRDVALKELTLARAPSWKSVELFDRETAVLRTLDHPRIPAYVHAFHDEEGPGGGARFFLAQRLVDGEGLDRELVRRQWSEGDAVALLRQLIDVLGYLHGHSPPVVHRDIKPSNLVRAADGSVALIDFGAVQTVTHGAGGGSTVVGTSGYMPLEQYMGRAEPASDLYAVGATLVHLLSRQDPSELPLRRSRIAFEHAVNVSSGFSDILSRLLAPSVEDRFGSAAEVAAALDALDAPARLAPSDDLMLVPRPRRSLFERFVWVVCLSSLAMGFGQTMSFLSPRACAGSRGDVLEAVNRCPAAAAALGDDIDQTFVGFACVPSSESSGNCTADSWSGYENATMRVEGSRASGQLDFSATMRGCGNWSLTSATVEVDGETITVVPCATAEELD